MFLIDETIALVGGLIWGSFMSVCIDRLEIRFSEKKILNILKEDSKVSKKLKVHILKGDLSPINPKRSFCFTCDHQLNWYQLIPVFSYIYSAGKCLNCGKSLGSRIFLVELSHALFFLVIIYSLNITLEALILCINFSFIWLLTYSHSYPILGSVLKIIAVILIGINGIIFYKFLN